MLLLSFSIVGLLFFLDFLRYLRRKTQFRTDYQRRLHLSEGSQRPHAFFISHRKIHNFHEEVTNGETGMVTDSKIKKKHKLKRKQRKQQTSDSGEEVRVRPAKSRLRMSKKVQSMDDSMDKLTLSIEQVLSYGSKTKTITAEQEQCEGSIKTQRGKCNRSVCTNINSKTNGVGEEGNKGVDKRYNDGLHCDSIVKYCSKPESMMSEVPGTKEEQIKKKSKKRQMRQKSGVSTAVNSPDSDEVKQYLNEIPVSSLNINVLQRDQSRIHDDATESIRKPLRNHFFGQEPHLPPSVQNHSQNINENISTRQTMVCPQYRAHGDQLISYMVNTTQCNNNNPSEYDSGAIWTHADMAYSNYGQPSIVNQPFGQLGNHPTTHARTNADQSMPGISLHSQSLRSQDISQPTASNSKRNNARPLPRLPVQAETVYPYDLRQVHM